MDIDTGYIEYVANSIFKTRLAFVGKFYQELVIAT